MGVGERAVSSEEIKNFFRPNRTKIIYMAFLYFAALVLGTVGVIVAATGHTVLASILKIPSIIIMLPAVGIISIFPTPYVTEIILFAVPLLWIYLLSCTIYRKRRNPKLI